MINRYHQIPIWSHKTWYYQSHSTFKVNAGVPYITESHGSQLPRISGTLVTIGKSLVGGLLMVIIHITIWWYMLYQLLISLTIIYIYIYVYIYICIYIYIVIWYQHLVGGFNLPLWKNHGQLVSWGPMTFPIFLESHIAAMFQSPPISQSMYCQWIRWGS